MTRIVYFLPDIDAGAARVVKNLLFYRPENTGIEYAVVLFYQTDSLVKHTPVTDGLKADEIIRFGFASTENAFAIYKRLQKVLKSDQDIIVSNDGFELRMVVAGKLTNPVVYILHGDFNYYYNVIRLNQQVIDGIITIANKMEQQVQQVVSAENKHKVCKIYYPAAIVADKSVQRQRYPSENFSILFVGTLDERKGADILFTIYTEIIEQGVTDFFFEIVGDGVLFKKLQEQFKNSAGVVLSGWASNSSVLKKMGEADIFLFPSTVEGLPNVLVEALSVGAVPVSSNLESGVKDIIEDQLNGVLVTSGDVKGFATAIVALYHNREKLRYLQSNSTIGLEKFSPYVQAAEYENKILNFSRERTLRSFPKKYNMGRTLNKSWIPNWFVKTVRTIVKHPKF